MLLRFPYLGEAIFQKIDNKSLALCQLVSGSWYRFIQYQKRPTWVRIKHLLVKNIETLSKDFHGVPIFYGSKFNGSFVKLFFSAMHNKTICSHKVEDRNPSNEWGETPLHYAADHCHLEVCKLIIQSVDEKNPKNNEGDTPLHFAARRGKASICELIMKNILDKNPKAFDGSTPLHEAAKANQSHQDHLNVCKILVENGADKNSMDQKGRTPIAYAYYQNNENSPLFQYLSSLL